MSESQTEVDTQPTPLPRAKARGSEGTTVGEFTLIAGVAVAVALGMSFWMRSNAPPQLATGGLAVGRVAPEVTAPLWINGQPEPADGRVRVVHGWFPGCPNCWREAPELVALHEKYGDRVQFIGLSPRPAAEEEEHLAFVERNKIDWPNGVAAVETLLAFGSEGWFPAAWVVDGNGRIVWNGNSAAGGVTLEQGIERALATGTGQRG